MPSAAPEQHVLDAGGQLLLSSHEAGGGRTKLLSQQQVGEASLRALGAVPGSPPGHLFCAVWGKRGAELSWEGK